MLKDAERQLLPSRNCRATLSQSFRPAGASIQVAEAARFSGLLTMWHGPCHTHSAKPALGSVEGFAGRGSARGPDVSGAVPMENAALIGLSRQIALGRELDVIANNMANVSTNGYKARQSRFEEFLMPGASAAAFRQPGRGFRSSPRPAPRSIPRRVRSSTPAIRSTPRSRATG